MARKKKAHDGEHENAERWLLTYADMITLLMAFFIMMYSMSVVNMDKFNQAAISIRSGFGGMLKGGKGLLERPSGGMTDRSIGSSSEAKNLSRVENTLKDMIVTEQLEAKMEVRRESRGLVISITSDDFLFPEGAAQLSPQAVTLLEKIKRQLMTTSNDLLVEGHTCNKSISNAVFPSNWELSSARACRVVRYMADGGIAQKRLTAVGYGETRPRYPNDTDAHRAHNRRVDIVVLSGSRSVKHGKSSVPDVGGEQPSLSPGLKPSFGKVWTPAGEEDSTHE
ncbi:MAG: flagellar motor protein MotB [Armatimonadota bacterium]